MYSFPGGRSSSSSRLQAVASAAQRKFRDVLQQRLSLLLADGYDKNTAIKILLGRLSGTGDPLHIPSDDDNDSGSAGSPTPAQHDDDPLGLDSDAALQAKKKKQAAAGPPAPAAGAGAGQEAPSQPGRHRPAARRRSRGRSFSQDARPPRLPVHQHRSHTLGLRVASSARRGDVDNLMRAFKLDRRVASRAAAVRPHIASAASSTVKNTIEEMTRRMNGLTAGTGGAKPASKKRPPPSTPPEAAVVEAGGGHVDRIGAHGTRLTKRGRLRSADEEEDPGFADGAGAGAGQPNPNKRPPPLSELSPSGMLPGPTPASKAEDPRLPGPRKRVRPR